MRFDAAGATSNVTLDYDTAVDDDSAVTRLRGWIRCSTVKMLDSDASLDSDANIDDNGCECDDARRRANVMWATYHCAPGVGVVCPHAVRVGLLPNLLCHT
eukprot:2082692-Rhodomonas_salina.1